MRELRESAVGSSRARGRSVAGLEGAGLLTSRRGVSSGGATSEGVGGASEAESRAAGAGVVVGGADAAVGAGNGAAGGSAAPVGAAEGVVGDGDAAGATDGVADGAAAVVGDAAGADGVGDAFSSLARRRIRSLTNELTDEIFVSTQWMAALPSKNPEACWPRTTTPRAA